MRRTPALLCCAGLALAALATTAPAAQAAPACGQTYDLVADGATARVMIACVNGGNKKASGWIKDTKGNDKPAYFGADFVPGVARPPIWAQDNHYDDRAVEFRNVQIGDRNTICAWSDSKSCK